ncbi:MAG: ECF transporter S component [Spirochaetaceae bacterium]|jgi:uncharacterized membrane protein|nr:ECF transporter S component [Spirochaetaceae bacterium]
MRKIAVTGVLASLSIVLGITGLGLITWFPGASLTTMHVPVIIGAILEGPIVGLVIGLLFGVFSLIQASLIAVNPADMAFINPLISVVPRLFIGPASWLVYASISGSLRITDKKIPVLRESLALIISAIAGSLTNTVLVLSALALFKVIPWAMIGLIALTNGSLEAALSALIVFVVLAAWKHLPRHGGRSRLNR